MGLLYKDNNNVCAIIVSYNGGDVISNAVMSLIDQVADIVIVDNGSNIETLVALRKLESNAIKVIFNVKNTGVAYALNQGVVYALTHQYDWVLTMDQDSTAEPAMVKKLLDCASCFDAQSNSVSFSPVIVYGSNIHSVNSKLNFVERYTVITSGNLLKTDIFKHIGLFEEKLFIDSVDFEFCLRIKKHGFKIMRCNNALLNHSLGSIDYFKIFKLKIPFTLHSPFRKYYIMRNHIYITKKYFLQFPIYCLWKQIAMIRLILQILFFEKNKFSSLKYIVRGFYDGIFDIYQNTSLHIN